MTILQQGYKDLGYSQITNVSAAVGLGTIPDGTTLVLVAPETQGVRWRSDGTDPTATVGYPLSVGSELQFSAAQIPRLKFIEQAASAKLNVYFFGIA